MSPRRDGVADGLDVRGSSRRARSGERERRRRGPTSGSDGGPASPRRGPRAARGPPRRARSRAAPASPSTALAASQAVPGPAVPGQRPVVEREPQRGQVLVDPGDRRAAARTVARGRSRGTRRGRQRTGACRPARSAVDAVRRRPSVAAQPRQHRPGLGERVGPVGRRVHDRDGVGGQVAPASRPARSCALEQGEARQVAERLGGVQRRDAIQRRARAADERRRTRAGAAACGNGPPAGWARGDDMGAVSRARRRTVGEATCAARELGIRIGRLEPGAHDAITDVRGVRVGHATLIEGDGAARRRPRARCAPA